MCPGEISILTSYNNEIIISYCERQANTNIMASTLDTVSNILGISMHCNLTIALWYSYSDSHFTDERIEAQRGKTYCSKIT